LSQRTQRTQTEEEKPKTNKLKPTMQANQNNQYVKIELSISGRNLRNLDVGDLSDPIVRVYLKDHQTWFFIGQTETKMNELNPDFDTTFMIDYKFETIQPIKFDVLDVDSETTSELIGTVETTVGEIMGAKSQTLVLDLQAEGAKSCGKIVLCAEKGTDDRNLIIWEWNGLQLMNTDGPYDKSDPFLIFYKMRPGGTYGRVFETEVIKNNLNPKWNSFQIVDSKLCKDHDQKFKIECWDWEKGGRHQFIGACEVTLEMIKSGKTIFELQNSYRQKPPGSLKVSNFFLQKPYSFIDYIRGGTQLNVVVAIDFTASNGPLPSKDSLHALLSNGNLNEYQKAIVSVCQIILNYDFDQNIPVLGFGGVPNYPKMKSIKTSHCFPCTGDSEQEQVHGLDGIMGVYSYALQNVDMSGPTYFSPLINKVCDICQLQKEANQDVYTILLILTDGEIHDMNPTIDAIVEASDLPLSIIIVGIGNDKFGNMAILDGDHGLYNSEGQKAKRDLVQFVPFREFNGDMNLLAQNVLAEIPDQIVNYMQLSNRLPGSPSPQNIEELGYTEDNPAPQK